MEELKKEQLEVLAREELLEVPDNIEDFRVLLTMFGINLKIWDEKFPDVDRKLLKDLLSNESVLAVKKTLVRKLEIANVRVFFTDGHKKYMLVEDKQEITASDGITRVVKREEHNHVSEKLRIGEKALEAAKRGLLEELGFDASNYTIRFLDAKTEVKDAPFYPGLLTSFRVHTFEASISKEVFKEEGYEEQEENRRTFFVWKELT